MVCKLGGCRLGYYFDLFTKVCVKIRIENCVRGENMIVTENDVCTVCEGDRNLVSSLYTEKTDYCSYDCPIGLMRTLDTKSKVAITTGLSIYRCLPCPSETPFLFVGKCWEECKNDDPSTIGGMFTVVNK